VLYGGAEKRLFNHHAPVVAEPREQFRDRLDSLGVYFN
jgi:hypothetical protein